jgi:hypothetical protein
MDYLQFSTPEGERVSFIREGDIVFVIYHEDEVQDAPVKWTYGRMLEKTREIWKKS